MNWEEVFRSENEVLSRIPLADTASRAMRPAEGWIYRYMQRTGSDHGGYTWNESITFVPGTPAP